jgi:hypothetical protein
MNSSGIRGIGGPSGNWQVGLPQIEGVTPATANTPLPGHAHSLTLASLSPHSFDSLKAKESHGSESEKQLSSRVKDLMQKDLLLISPNQQQTGTTGTTGIVQYGRSPRCQDSCRLSGFS